MLNVIVDNAISFFSPRWAASRMAYRNDISRLQASAGIHRSMQQMFAGSKGGYEAGKSDRLKGRIIGSPHENDVPRQQIKALRYRTWNLYRNCPQARKIRRTLSAKVIGRGLCPQSQATNKDGTPFTAFRKRARQVFDEFSKESDWRGKPGAGGQNFVTQSKTAFGANLLSGGVLYQFHHLSLNEQRQLGLFVPLQVQLLHVDRLDETKNGDNQFFGVETDTQGRVKGYHVLKGGAKNTEESMFVPVEKMRHLFAEEDIDQFLGASWFGAALLTMDDRRGYEYSELIAAEMASCIVGAYRLASGQSQYGLQTDSSSELTDSNGNRIDRLQPGLLLNLGANGEFQVQGSERPNSNAGEFLSHLIRSEAVSMPGVKTSTLTGDYRNSSFSSERSADNDIWPEIEELQDWFSVGFCQPIYEEVIKAAVLAGHFDQVEGFSADDFNARQREYLAANWQGPVSRSINPKDDAAASALRVKNANSTPQIEAAMLGRDVDQILDGVQEFIEKCEARSLPEEFWKNALGIEPMPEPAGDGESEQQQDEKAASNRLRNFSLQNSA
jgi:lambda family phage portal protein